MDEKEFADKFEELRAEVPYEWEELGGSHPFHWEWVAFMADEHGGEGTKVEAAWSTHTNRWLLSIVDIDLDEAIAEGDGVTVAVAWEDATALLSLKAAAYVAAMGSLFFYRKAARG